MVMIPFKRYAILSTAPITIDLSNTYLYCYLHHLRRLKYMITIIGTAHVFDISDQLRDEIIRRHPSVVAVELDKQRYASLMAKGGSRKGTPLIYRAMSMLQKRIADDFDVKVGSEMLEAIETAKDLGIGVAFIDLPADLVFRKMMKTMSIKEKVFLIGGLVVGLFTSKEKVEQEMERYQKNEGDYMDILAENMPSISKILIDDRNRFMAESIKELDKKYDSIVAVVGDGHVPGLLKELDDKEVETVRLRELRSKNPNTTNAEVSFSISYQRGNH